MKWTRNIPYDAGYHWALDIGDRDIMKPIVMGTDMEEKWLDRVEGKEVSNALSICAIENFPNGRLLTTDEDE